MSDEWHRVASLRELEPEYPTRVKLGVREFALCLVEGKVFAIDNICSHAFARLSDGHLEDHQIVCPLHGGRFDLRTGEAVELPCDTALPVFETKLDGDEVYLKFALSPAGDSGSERS